VSGIAQQTRRLLRNGSPASGYGTSRVPITATNCTDTAPTPHRLVNRGHRLAHLDVHQQSCIGVVKVTPTNVVSYSPSTHRGTRPLGSRRVPDVRCGHRGKKFAVAWVAQQG
jgi:hypothetical protein